jgi:hypothetical protein
VTEEGKTKAVEGQHIATTRRARAGHREQGGGQHRDQKKRGVKRGKFLVRRGKAPRAGG